MACTFFFSYARSNASPYLEQFYQDLLGTIQARTGRHEADIVFRDVAELEPGDRWPDEIAGALSTCRAFLSLWSPTYFTREYCGREWQAFAQRLDAYAVESLRPVPPLVVPILWIPPGSRFTPLPRAVTAVQSVHRDLGETYAREGLEHLLRLDLRTEYQRALTGLVKRLVEVVEAHELPAAGSLPDLATIESAFHRRDDPAVAEPPEGRGVRKVKFAVVAGTRDELRSLRRLLDGYGHEAEDWSPYQVTGRIGVIAQRVASDQGLTSEFLPLDADLAERLARAKQANNVVLLSPFGTIEFGNEETEPSLLWLERLRDRFRHAVWLNPIPREIWPGAHGRTTIRKIGEVFRMEDLTLGGIKRAVEHLSRG